MKEVQRQATLWKGLPPKRFKKYEKWINRIKPGICGTYVSAVLLHDAFLHSYRVSLDQQKLLKGLKPMIEDRFVYRGTFVWDLWLGLSYALKDIAEIKVKMSLLPELTVVRLLDSPDPKPIAVGTTKLLGSKYKNHWLVVYSYRYNKEGKLEFKAYDNHGRYQAIVPASKTIGCVWLAYDQHE